MRSYIIRRLLLLIPTLFFVTVIIFLLVRFVPGTAVDIIEANLSRGGTTNIDREAIAHALGLDVPIHIQYKNWITGILFQGDLGTSIIQSRPVLEMIMERMPVTLELGIFSLLIMIIISLPLGIYSAIRQDTLADYIGRTIAILFMAIPIFWTATLVMIYPSIWWGWSPPVELITFSEDPLGNLSMFILPAAIVGMMIAGMGMRLTRTTMLDVMRQDYIRTAWAKGLDEKVVILRHAIKNSMIPVVTMIGGSIGVLLSGQVIIEQIFCIPGIGQLLLQALNQRDYPLISGITLILSLFVMFSNLIVDISYSWLDPRVRYK